LGKIIAWKLNSTWYRLQTVFNYCVVNISGIAGQPGKEQNNERKTSYPITNFAETARTRERFARMGPKSLSNPELLEILLRV
jgi:hypothetical protein